jgi:Transglutaminase-like superfamily
MRVIPQSPRLFAAIGARVWLVLYRLHIRRASFDRVLDTCLVRPGSVHPDPDEAACAVRYVEIYRRVLRLKCLERSLVLCYFLRKAGTAVTLNVGVQGADDTLKGHAWLSLGDDVVFEREQEALAYTRVLTCPPAGSPAGLPRRSR